VKLLATLAILVITLVMPLRAADVSGTWVGDVPRRDGGVDKTTFELKVDDDRVSGTVTTPVNTYEIKGGLAQGDDVEFYIAVNMGREVRFTYTGKVNGDEIVFSREIQGMAIRTSFVAKRPQ
jgi:hypothetical protein